MPIPIPRAAPLSVALGLLLASAVVTQAQGVQAPPISSPASGTPSARRVANATKVVEAPVIDAEMGDPVWRQATPLVDFVQTEPQEGQPASERTEVRLLYDDTYIYVGVWCYDSAPSQIVVTDSRRDSSLSDADSFQMVFDTYHDRQSGFLFGTNPAGMQYDAQVRDEGQGGGGQGGGAAFGSSTRAIGGSGAGLNLNWDSTWDVEARITEAGWVAEFRIALRSLRYGQPPQTWGVNFARNVRRTRELSYWSPLERQYTINRLSSAGDLEGLDLKTPRNLKLAPYAISSVNRNFTPSSKTDLDGDFGVDAKFGVTPSLNLDLTYNTDFAQVEVDEQQINLTRFNLLFPEKRPFFLENAGLFAVGRSGEADLFFSRRIGITDDGTLVPIRGGARLSGKVKGTNIGLLDIQTEGVDLTPANNVSAARVKRELPNRSSLGAIFVGRQATGDTAGPDNWNRAWGVDGKLGVGEALTFSGFAAKTETPSLTEREYGYTGGVEYRDRKHRTYVEYGAFAEDFNPEVGFLRRPEGARRLSTGFFETLRGASVRAKGFRELFPHVSYVRYDNMDGGLQTATLHMDNHLDWENGNYIAPAINVQWEGLDRPFEVYPGVVVPAGVYRNAHTAFRTNTDRRKWISASYDLDYGGFLSGHQNSMSPAIAVRQGATLNIAARWSRSDIDLPEGAFVTNLSSIRATYNFSTSLFAQALIQYNDRTRRWSTNLRATWLNTASTGLYVVYNDTEAFSGLGPVNRAFIVKYSREFDLIR